MELTVVYNPQKSRLETLHVDLTGKNTTWFRSSGRARAVATITDLDGGLLIKALYNTYPIWIYDISRTYIDYNPKRAKEIMRQYG